MSLWTAAGLVALALCLHLYHLDDRPGFPHFFENDTLVRELRPGLTPRDVLQQPWRTRYQVFREWGNGDVDHVGFSWPWVLAVDRSRRLFGETPLAHRLPSAVMGALSAAIFYSIVRRFYWRQGALACGILLATSPLHLTFARNGGYVAATLTLLLALHFFALRISLEDSRRAWLGFTSMLLFVPYAYAPSRYLALVAFLPILGAMIRDRAFARHHAPGLAACTLTWLLCALPNVAAKHAYLQDWGAATSHAALMFFSGSGEQLFTADHPDQRRLLVHEIARSGNVDTIDYGDTTDVAEALVLLRLKQWWSVYWRGENLSPRVSWDPPANYRIARLWPGILAPTVSALGLVVCIVRSFRNGRWRELLLVTWSLATWMPLLLTTQVNGNRTMAGLPPDYYFLSVGAFVLVHPLRARLTPSRRRSFDALAVAFLAAFVAARIHHYFGALPAAGRSPAASVAVRSALYVPPSRA